MKSFCSRKPLLVALPVLLLAILSCSTNTVTTDASRIFDARPGAEASGDTAVPTWDGKPPADSSAADASTGDQLTSDPLNCGSAGHSCLGRTCTAGFCDVEAVRGGITRAIAIHGGDLVRITDGSNGALALKVGLATPMASEKSFPIAGSIWFDRLQVQDGYLYARRSQDEMVGRWDLATGAEETVASGVSDYDIDATHAYYVSASDDALWRTPLGGGTPTKVVTGISGSLAALVDGLDDVYVATITLGTYRVPKSGGSAVFIPVSSYPSKHVAWMYTTPTRIVGSGYTHSNPVDCASTTSAVWSIPRTGGTATVLMSQTGMAARTVVDGENVYWQELECNTGGPAPKSVIRRRRADGGPIVNIAQGPSVDTELAVDAQYLYFISGVAEVMRAPK